jgi:protein-disulfide isomerase
MIPKTVRVAGASVFASLLLVAAAPAAEPSFSGPQKAEIEMIVRDYLLTHPEVLQEAIAELDKRQSAADTEKAKAAVAANAETLFDSPRQVVLGNPKGDVTLVEFFDYNCGFCKGALPALMDLMKDDAKLKVVLKEFPVLGPGSVEAAKVAVAVRMQDKTGKKYIEFHQKLLGGRGKADKARAMAVAKEIGMDMARLEKDMASDEVRLSLEESLKLAETLNLNGTPSYVVGNDVVVGAVGLDALRGKIATARCGKETC